MRLLCLPGDGIGPEIMTATQKVVQAACGEAAGFEMAKIGFDALKAAGTTIPKAVLELCDVADGVILGPVSHNAYPPLSEGGLNPSGVIRKHLGLFANIRPARSFDGVPKPIQQDVDLVVMRENLEGFYADRNMHAGSGEVMPVPGVALATRKITAEGSARIAQATFDLARREGRKRVTAVHKANVMRLSDGLFLDEVRKVAAEYADIAYDEVLVDAAAALLVRDPSRFGVIVTTNMFGDILSDLASELAGGLGLAASLNLGATNAVAQAQHGSAPDIAGQDRANPVSLILSSAMLLRHLGAADAADRIGTAVTEALRQPETRTADLQGTLGTQAFATNLCTLIARTGP
ncbi:MAG: isocitrate/isopropylmalate dehydrogenase family protein [Pseudomonadota bacterium]